MEHRTIIKKFGGVRPMATALGHKNPTTVSYWWTENKIPHWRWHEVIDAAKKRRLGVKLTDFNGGTNGRPDP